MESKYNSVEATGQTEISLTVIIPFYCTPDTLFWRCLTSVLPEGRQDVEVLVVNDGSSAEYNALLGLAEKDSRVRVIHLPHKGVSVARNTGLREAKGKWVTFVDADDHLDQETYRWILDNLESIAGEVEIFTGGMDYGTGEPALNSDFLEENHNYAATDEDKAQIMESALSVGLFPRGYVQFFTYGSACSKLFNRSFLVRNHLQFDESVSFAEDCLFMLHVYQSASAVFFHNRPLYYYVNNGLSTTRKHRPGLSKDMDVFFRRTEEFLRENHLETRLEKAFYARAQYEVKRSFCYEFFHRMNKDPHAGRKYRQFIRKEPYRTALQKDYFPKINSKQQVLFIMVKYGWGGAYRLYVRILRMQNHWRAHH